MGERADVVVVGGGVVGLACANELLDAGLGVHVVERETIGSGASHGNCGLITPSHALPLTRPGMVRKALCMLGRADAPVRIVPRLDLGFLAWGVRFARSCSPARMREVLRGRAALLESSRDLFPELFRREDLDCEWEEQGLLEVYATREAWEAAEPTHRLLAEHGIRVEPYDRDALLREEPALREDVYGGLRYLRDAQLRPEALVRGLERRVREKGATIDEGCAVQGFRLAAGRVDAVATDRGDLPCAHVVLATGAWSPKLGRPLGARLPVQPGKGYSITLARPEPCPALPLLLVEANMAVTPWPSGLRLGGMMEFAGYDNRLSRPRLDALHAGARRYLRQPPEPSGGEEWCGWRPMTPDELPVLDRAPRARNAILATGHGMMGVSMAPATARLVGDLVLGREPFVDPAPYALERFG